MVTFSSTRRTAAPAGEPLTGRGRRCMRCKRNGHPRRRHEQGAAPSRVPEEGRNHGRFIAITGSNGKTTTKELLVHLICGLSRVVASEKNYNNQVGVAKTMLAIVGEPGLLHLRAGHEPHRRDTQTGPAWSGPTCPSSPTSRRRTSRALADLEGVRREKLDLFEATLPGGAIFINADDPSLSPYSRPDCTLYSFGMKGRADFMLRVCRPGASKDSSSLST